jgi:hypothetical protein
MTENLRQRDGDQPLPTEGQENVQDRLLGLIKERRALGVQRYGRPLQTFNGRNAIRDLIEELLDGATYAMQVEMEQEALKVGVRGALKLHAADQGLCRTCATKAPCATRVLLVAPHKPQPQPQPQLIFTEVHPVEEIAVHPDSMGAFKEHMKLVGVEERLGNPIDELYGIPILADESIAPGYVRMRPHGFDNHPAFRSAKEQTP